MSDLKRFIELYATIGVYLPVERKGQSLVVDFMRCEDKEKFVYQDSCHSVISFDLDGNFENQWFGET